MTPIRMAISSSCPRNLTIERSGHALTLLGLDLELFLLAQVDEILGRRVVEGQSLEIAEPTLRAGQVDAPKVGGSRLAVGMLGRVEGHQTVDRLRDAARGHLRRQPPERRAAFVDATSQHHEVLRDHLVTQFANAALEA